MLCLLEGVVCYRVDFADKLSSIGQTLTHQFVALFAVLRDVESSDFLFSGHAEADYSIDNFENNERTDYGNADSDKYTDSLIQKLS